MPSLRQSVQQRRMRLREKVKLLDRLGHPEQGAVSAWEQLFAHPDWPEAPVQIHRIPYLFIGAAVFGSGLIGLAAHLGLKYWVEFSRPTLNADFADFMVSYSGIFIGLLMLVLSTYLFEWSRFSHRHDKIK